MISSHFTIDLRDGMPDRTHVHAFKNEAREQVFVITATYNNAPHTDLAFRFASADQLHEFVRWIENAAFEAMTQAYGPDWLAD
jgi:hypothetical protein